MDRGQTETTQRIAEALESGADKRVLDELGALHAADVADVLEELERAQQIMVLKYLGTERAAEVLTEVDEHSGQALLQLLSDNEVVSLLGEMPSDDAADLIATLTPEKTAQIDALMPVDEREKLHELMEFEEDTAGGIMEVEKVALNQSATVQDAITLVRRVADDIENLQSVYITDGAGHLIGIVPVLNLLLHEPHTPVKEIMDDYVISVPVEMDQEEVAALFSKYDEFTLPVVDAEGVLVGRITVDDIIDVLEEEASEDIARIAGTVEDEIGETSPLRISRARLPWLIIAMLGQLLNAFIMNVYSAPLETLITLTFFVPLVIGTAGSTGVQSAIVVVREIAVGQSSTMRIGRRVFQEVQVTLLNGLVLGVILFVAVTVWRKETGLALLMLSALVSVTLAAAVLGASLPLLMKRAKVDPAIATGPFITVVCDMIALAIYLSLSAYYLSIVRPTL